MIFVPKSVFSQVCGVDSGLVKFQASELVLVTKNLKTLFYMLQVYKFAYSSVTSNPRIGLVCHLFLQVYLMECEVWFQVSQHSERHNPFSSLKTS